MCFADVYRQTDSFAEAMSSTHGLKDFSSIWTFALTFGIVLSKQRRGSRWSDLATLRRPKCNPFWPTLLVLCNVTVELLHELGVDVLLDESRHGVRVFFGWFVL